MWDSKVWKDFGWLFIELQEFDSVREKFFVTDEGFSALQSYLINNPTSGDAMPGCGGLRKVRLQDPRRAKGKRGGLRLIYLQVPEVKVFVLIRVYNKDQKDDLSPTEKKILSQVTAATKAELIQKYSVKTRGRKTQ